MRSWHCVAMGIAPITMSATDNSEPVLPLMLRSIEGVGRFAKTSDIAASAIANTAINDLFDWDCQDMLVQLVIVSTEQPTTMKVRSGAAANRASIRLTNPI